MNRGVIFDIDAASVFSDIGIEGELYMIPDPNKEYKYGMVSDAASASAGLDFLFASKDAKTWVLALCVIINGEKKVLYDFIQEEDDGSLHL